MHGQETSKNRKYMVWKLCRDCDTFNLKSYSCIKDINLKMAGLLAETCW